MDFVSNPLIDGRWFRALRVVDQFTRECVVLLVDNSLTRNARLLSHRSRGFLRPKGGAGRETRGSHSGWSGVLNVREAGLRHHSEEIPNRDRAAYSIGPGFKAIGHRCR